MRTRIHPADMERNAGRRDLHDDDNARRSDRRTEPAVMTKRKTTDRHAPIPMLIVMQGGSPSYPALPNCPPRSARCAANPFRTPGALHSAFRACTRHCRCHRRSEPYDGASAQRTTTTRTTADDRHPTNPNKTGCDHADIGRDNEGVHVAAPRRISVRQTERRARPALTG